MDYRRIFIYLSFFVLFAGVGLLSGCGGINLNRTDPEHTDYYQGSEGIYMRFLPGTPPSRVFYYSGGTPAENSFDVSVELQNRGASDAIGALYISGFSPDIVEVEGTSIQPMAINDCVFDINSFLQGDVGFFFSCSGFEGSFNNEDNWHVRILDIGEKLGISALEGWDSITIGTQGGNWNLNLGWDNFGNVDVLNHGRALALALASIDFRRYNGYPLNGGREKIGTGVMKGDNYYYPGGEIGFQDFVAHVGREWPAGLDETDVDFMVTSCYGYTTYAAPQICIDPAPYDESKKVCTVQQYKWSGSQGAPVAIASLKQDPTPRSLYLTFTVRNVGGGEVFNLGYLERCSPYFPGRMDSRHKNVVYIGDIRIGDQRLTCTPSYEIRLNNGVGTFTCEYQLEYATAKTAYETPVVVELWYGYQETIRTSVHIKRAA